METLHPDMFIRVTGKSPTGRLFSNYFVPKRDIMNHLEKDGKTVKLEYFKKEYTCKGMFKKGFVIEKAEIVSNFVQSRLMSLSGISTQDFDCNCDN
jgi:hypothetical protein